MLEGPIESVCKSENGFLLECWRFWGDRLSELATKQELSDGARADAKQTREAMERIRYVQMNILANLLWAWLFR